MNVRTEMIRFLRADRESKGTARISCQRLNNLICNMYCTEKWPVLIYSTPKKYAGAVRSKNFELVILHGAACETNLEYVNEVLKLTGFGVKIIQGPEEPELIAQFLNATQDADKEKILIPEHMSEFDGLVVDHQFYKYARFIGVKNRRFLWWTPADAHSAAAVIEVP